MSPRKRLLELIVLAALATGCQQPSTASSGSSAAPSGDESASATAPASADGSSGEANGGSALPPRSGAAVVDLGGVANLPAPIDAQRSKVAALEWVTPIHARPDPSSKRLGSLRAGAIVAAAAEPAGTAGCPGGWRAIEPVGYVCLGRGATADLSHPIVRAAARRPDYAHRLPYMYGTCTRGGPIYAQLPTKADLEKYEPHLEQHLRKWRNDKKSGAHYGLDVWLRYARKPTPPAWEAYEQGLSDEDEDIPWFLRAGGRVPDLSGLLKEADGAKIGQIDRRTGRSFIYSLLYQGRRYNVTPDLVVIPADRFRPIRGSSFHGWQIPADIELPFAAIRRAGARKWLWNSKKKRMVDGGALEWRSAWPLSGKRRVVDGKLHYQTEEGFWVDDRHASRIDLPGPRKGSPGQRRWPKWATAGEKWIDINITKQSLLAYEGKTPVYATLVSTGEAGLGDPEKSTATIRGIYRIHTKLVAATMDSDEVGEEFELRDVPYVQYFKEGYALHGAYWHDKFGRPKSHGCINLAPEDARRLFWWTGPELPPRWHSARKALTGTVIFVHQ